MAVCSTEVPAEVRFDDGVRVACHLFPSGAAATAETAAPLTVPAGAAVEGAR